MKNLITLLMILISVTAFAADKKQEQKKKPTGDDKLHIHQLDPNFDAEKLKGDGVVLHKYDPKQQVTKLPDPQLRDINIEKAGLTEQTAKWDELEKDVLYLRAQTFTPKELHAAYKDIGQEKLDKLADLAKAPKK